MRKRILTVALSVALIGSMFAGCSGSSSSSSSSTAESSSSAVEESSSDVKEEGLKKFDDVKLKLLHCWNGGVKNPEDLYGNDVATAIRDKIGVTVEIEGIMMNETEKLNLVFASGDMPDMINAPFWGGDGGETAVLKKAGAEGRLLALDDLINNYPNIKDAWSVGVVSQAFLENDLEIPTFEGKHYILPTQTPGEVASITNWTYGIFARKDIVEAVGMDPASIKTSDKLLEFLTKVRDGGFKDVNGNDIIPASTFHTGWDRSGYTVNFRNKKFTSYVKGADGKYTYNVFTDDWMDEQLFTWKLVNEGILDKECFKHSDTQAEEKTGNGTAAVMSLQYGPIITATKKSGLYTSNPEMRYVPIGPLTYKDGQPQVQTEYYGRGGTPCLVFPTTNKNLEASLAWVDYLNSEEGARLAQYGIEGKTYNMVDGKPRLLPELIERKRAGDGKIDDELRNLGINVYGGSTLLADKRMSWWGEMNAGDADAEDPDMKAYKLLKPVEQIKGYPIDKLAMAFPEYETVKRIMFEGTRLDDTVQMAFFAKTEAEARKILEEYRSYLKKAEGGIVEKYLAFVDEVSTSRDDVID